MQRARAREHEAAGVAVGRQFRRHVGPFQQLHRLARFRQQLGPAAQRVHRLGCMRTGEAAGAAILAVQCLPLDQLLEVVERLLRLLEHRRKDRRIDLLLQLRVGTAEARTAGERATISRRRPPADRLAVEHDGDDTATRQLQRRRQPGDPTTDDDDIRPGRDLVVPWWGRSLVRRCGVPPERPVQETWGEKTVVLHGNRCSAQSRSRAITGLGAPRTYGFGSASGWNSFCPPFV